MRVDTATWAPSTGWSPALPLPDGCPSLVLMFGCDADPRRLSTPITELSAAWDGHAILGCSTPALVTPDPGRDVTLEVTVARFDHARLRSCHVDIAAEGGPRAAGRAVAATLMNPELRGVIVVGDGQATNGAAFAAGFAELLPDIPLTGGFAGEADENASVWTVVAGRCRTGYVSAVALLGADVEFGFGSAGGWDVFGPERLVTQSYGSVLYELDGRPALSLYAEYLGDEVGALTDMTASYPLSIRDLDERTVVRSVSALNPTTDSLRLGGDVAQGAVAQLLQATPDRLIDGAYVAAERATIDGAELAIAISCIGRRLVLGERAGEEIDAALEALGSGVPVAGFYSAGSLAPGRGGSDLHNQMMSITTVRERTNRVAA